MFYLNMIVLAVFGIILFNLIFWKNTDRYYYYYDSLPVLPYIFLMLFFVVCLVVGILGVIGKLPA